MKRLGFVVVTTGIGGMEHYLLRLLKLLPRDIQTVVFVRSGQPGALHDAYVATGAKLIYGSFGYANPIRILGLYRCLRMARLDGITDLSGIFSGMTLTIARFAGIERRLVFHRRSTVAFQKTKMRRLFAQMSLWLIEKSATAILANSQTALRQFHGRAFERGDCRLAVIPNVLSPQQVAPSSPRKRVRANLNIDELAPVLLHVGRVDPAKDHPTLLRAIGDVLESLPHAHAILVGPNTEQLPKIFPDLFTRIDSARIHLLGARDDVADLAGAADAFVFTSTTEGQPNALLEAMASGLPVIASDIPPIREVIPQRGWELLVRPGDSAGFATAASACLADLRMRDARRYREETLLLTDPQRIVGRLLSLMLLEPSDACKAKHGPAQRVL